MNTSKARAALKARAGENSTYLGAALVAVLGGQYSPEMINNILQIAAMILGFITMIRGDK